MVGRQFFPCLNVACKQEGLSQDERLFNMEQQNIFSLIYNGTVLRGSLIKGTKLLRAGQASVSFTIQSWGNPNLGSVS